MEERTYLQFLRQVEDILNENNYVGIKGYQAILDGQVEEFDALDEAQYDAIMEDVAHADGARLVVIFLDEDGEEYPFTLFVKEGPPPDPREGMPAGVPEMIDLLTEIRDLLKGAYIYLPANHPDVHVRSSSGLELPE